MNTIDLSLRYDAIINIIKLSLRYDVIMSSTSDLSVRYDVGRVL